MRTPRDPVSQRAALALLARGMGYPGDIAELAGVSRQLVEQWAKSAGIDWRRVLRAKLTAAWRAEVTGKRAPARKARLRAIGQAAKRQWDQRP